MAGVEQLSLDESELSSIALIAIGGLGVAAFIGYIVLVLCRKWHCKANSAARDPSCHAPGIARPHGYPAADTTMQSQVA